jgi:hypothetical protein
MQIPAAEKSFAEIPDSFGKRAKPFPKARVPNPGELLEGILDDLLEGV